MKHISAIEFINNLILKSETYLPEDSNNIDLFVLDKEGNILNIQPTHKIHINGHNYYYTLTENNWIYLYKHLNFERLFVKNNTYNNYGWYGDHFSFGYSREFPDILNFHLTNYTFDMRSRQTKRSGMYCDFKISDFINDSKNPKCTARKSDKYLDTTFNDIFTPDLAYIKDIITFGLTRESIHINDDEYLYHGKVYKIQTGPKGGLFILVKETDSVTEKKVRITKQKNKQEPQQRIHNNEELNLTGGGSYTFKFKKLLGHFVLKFAKNNNIKLQNNTYIFVKQSTQHMVILFNYIMSPTDSKHTHQYILHVDTQLINKYMSPGVKNDAFMKNAVLVNV